MAIKRTQYLVGIINVMDLTIEGRKRIFKETEFANTKNKSTKTQVSENRAFRMFCNNKVEIKAVARDEKGRVQKDENGETTYTMKEIDSAEEFIVLNMSMSGLRTKSKRIARRHINNVLDFGFWLEKEDGTRVHYNRVLTSASQTRVDKRLFTSLPVNVVRDGVSYGAQFGDMVKIANMEARYGLAESSTIEISKEDYSFDIMPDYAIERKHDVKMYDAEAGNLYVCKDHEDVHNPLDGQGTMLPSAAVRTAFRLYLISKGERDMLLEWLDVYNEDVRMAENGEHVEFLKAWKKVPSAFQIRFGFTKGLLLVFPHNLYTTDANGSTYRAEQEWNEYAERYESVKCMDFWKQAGETVVEFDEDLGKDQHRRYYDFNRDIMFTDSMWKENFDPKYISKEMPSNKRAKLEIVLWQKNRLNETVFMGYQYWQSLNGKKVSPKEYADRAMKELKDTIFTNADDAKAFLGMYDTGRDAGEYADKMEAAGGKIQKVIELLTENPDMIREKYVQQTLRKTREKYIADMAKGRIPVKGGNPYIVTCPELQFGEEPLLGAGEYYYNGKESQFALFRSPLIHKSEAVVVDTVDVADYHVFNQDILIFNPFDDTLPRMGGADTDGDKVAMVEDEGICNAVETGLPMLFDVSPKAGAIENTRENLIAYDKKVILEEDVLSIGEITNMSTAWKDLAHNPRVLKTIMNDDNRPVTVDEVDDIVCILRFMQGWSIDYAKTGYFPEVPEYVKTKTAPHWKQFNILTPVNKEENVFVSKSPLGQLFNAMKEYYTITMKDEEKKIVRDFSLEFSAGADDNEVNRLEPIVAELENNYRRELNAMRDIKFDDAEQEEAHISHIMDKYTNAVQSIDGDIRDIAAAAYQHSYHESASKGKSASFPWVTCYEGLLLNAAQSTELVEGDQRETIPTKTKLRKVEFNCHIDDVPAELKFYRNEAKGDDYHVEARVLNGTYKTFKRNGQVFIKMPIASMAKKREVKRPVEKHATFQIAGFRHYGISSHELIEMLQESNGVIRVWQKKQNGELRQCVYIGKKQVASVSARNKTIMKQYVDETGVAEFVVQNVADLEPTFINKRNEEEDMKAYFLDTIFTRTLELKKNKKAKQEEVTSVEDRQEEVVRTSSDEQPYYVEDERGYDASYEQFKQHEEAYDEYEVATHGLEFDPAIFERINTSADYWTDEVDLSTMNVAGVSIEQTGALQFGVPCAVVTVTLANGQQGRVKVGMTAKNTFEVFRDKPMNSSFRALVLQYAHYELYADYIRKQA